MMTEPAIDPVKRAEVEEKIKKTLAVSGAPALALRVLLRTKYDGDITAQYLICEVILKIDPSNQTVQKQFTEAKKKLAEQSNKKTSPPSSPLSASPDANSSGSSSGSFAVSPMTPPRLSPAEKQKREFIQEAKQQIPQAIARMRAEMQAEVQSLAREMQELPVRKKAAEKIIQDVNAALKAAKIPEAVELSTLALKPYKLKDSKTIKYEKGKKTLKDLLIDRENARKVVAECNEALRVEKEGALSDIEAKYRGAIHFVGRLDRLVLTAEDLNESYDYAKSTGKADDQAEVPEFLRWCIAEKLEAMRQEDVAKIESEIAEIDRDRKAYIHDFLTNSFPSVKAQVLGELNKHQQQLKEEINELDRKIGEEQEEIQRAEAQLRSVGIPIRSANEQMAANAGRFGLHKSVPTTGRPQQPPIASANYATTAHPVFK